MGLPPLLFCITDTSKLTTTRRNEEVNKKNPYFDKVGVSLLYGNPQIGSSQQKTLGGYTFSALCV